MKGFRFNIDRCVACHACITACQLENAPEVPYRTVFKDSVLDYPGLPVHNISMACNHCEDAPCMEGCPVNAYFRHEESGAILIHEDRCIGCNYCVWNCPYDAPQYNSVSRTMQKCNLCKERIDIGIDPACTTACPTGALSFTEIVDRDTNESLIGTTGIGASLIFEGEKASGPRIIPEPEIRISNKEKTIKQVNNHTGEWSLMVFSFLSSLLVAINISDRFGLLGIPPLVYFTLCCITLIMPFFHLKRPLRAWRSLAGVFRSPLSTEILFLLLFLASSLAGYIFDPGFFWIISFISGLLLLIAIDNIYSFSDREIRYHPGQVFLIALIISSFLLGEILPFIFIVLIKIAALGYKTFAGGKFKSKGIIFLIVLITIYAFCLLALIIGGSLFLAAIPVLVLTELSLRIVYYRDFKPVSLIEKFYKINIEEYEKEPYIQ